MFHYLLKTNPSSFGAALKLATLQIFGDEPRNKGIGIEGLTSKDAMYFMSDEQTQRVLERSKDRPIMIAYRKIFIAILWPPKLLEVLVTYLYTLLDQVCLIGVDRDEKKILKPGLSTLEGLGDSFRFIGKAIVLFTFGLANELVKYIASPYNQLIKPIYRHFEIGIQEWRRGSELLLEAGDEQKVREAHWLRFQGVWQIAKTVLLVAAGLTAIGFMVAAIFFSSGAALPLLALIKPAMASVATFLGGSAIVGSVAEVLTLIVAFVASQIIMQKLLAIPAYCKDIWMGLTGQGGYNSKIHIEREFTARETADETAKAILGSTAFFYVCFNDSLVVPEDNSKVKAPRADQVASGYETNPMQDDNQDSDDEDNEDNEDDDPQASIIGARKVTYTKTISPSKSASPDQTGNTGEGQRSGDSRVTRASFAPSTNSAANLGAVPNPLSSNASSLVAKIGESVSDPKGGEIGDRDLFSTLPNTTPTVKGGTQ